MNHKDLQKAFSVIMAAAIITSLGTVNAINTNSNSDDYTLNTNSMYTSPSNISIEDIKAVLEFNK